METQSEESAWLQDIWEKFFEKSTHPKVIWRDVSGDRDGKLITVSVVEVERQPGQPLWSTAVCHEFGHAHLLRQLNLEDRAHETHIWRSNGIVPACENFTAVAEARGYLPESLR